MTRASESFYNSISVLNASDTRCRHRVVFIVIHADSSDEDDGFARKMTIIRPPTPPPQLFGLPPDSNINAHHAIDMDMA